LPEHDLASTPMRWLDDVRAILEAASIRMRSLTRSRLA